MKVLSLNPLPVDVVVRHEVGGYEETIRIKKGVTQYRSSVKGYVFRVDFLSDGDVRMRVWHKKYNRDMDFDILSIGGLPCKGFSPMESWMADKSLEYLRNWLLKNAEIMTEEWDKRLNACTAAPIYEVRRTNASGQVERVAGFFTRSAAESFLEDQNHNIVCGPWVGAYVYVASACVPRQRDNLLLMTCLRRMGEILFAERMSGKSRPRRTRILEGQTPEDSTLDW